MNQRLCSKFRCVNCSATLAVAREDGIEIRRGDFQAIANERVSIVCYRCHRLNNYTHPKAPRPAVAVGE